MTRLEAVRMGREALGRRAWGSAFQHLSAADGQAPLEPADLEALAECAHLVGRFAECAELLTRAHHDYLAAGEAVGAARCAFWLGFGAITAGEAAQAGGWLARARRLLDEGPHDCVERGWLLVPAAILAFRGGDLAGSHATFRQVAAAGARFRDADLSALGLLGQGRALLRGGALAEGLGLLDEAMVAVQADEVSPRTVGGIYCTALEACREILDLRRAQDWTAAADRWCRSQPDLVPYRGACLVQRAELLALHGAWPEALAEAGAALESLSRPRPGAEAAAALHLVGDLRRLRGEHRQAEEAYRQAGQWERAPHPGLALLRLAQGKVEGARAAIRHAVAAAPAGGERAAVLEAALEVALAVKDAPEARAAAGELGALATRLGAPLLRAAAARAAGAVRLAEGDAAGALGPLREGLAAWRELDAPYQAARTQVLLALACRADGGCEAAEQELAGARRTFERLGAAPDVGRVDALVRQDAGRGPLTARELEVLALVASGRTNRAVARELGLSEKTVARHLSNIFAKLDLSSRAAATAWAYQHDVVP
jgi:DNA-binding CsgD family transcriptional regulator